MNEIRVYMTPSLEQADPSNGIGRIIHAQYRFLPERGIHFVDDPDRADVVAVHAGTQITDKVDALHVHGFYWTGDGDTRHVYLPWHHKANQKIAGSCRAARVITVPSNWVGECLRRDFRINPTVIGHGIDVGDWKPGDNGGYVLWNKARAGDVCDPVPAYELARRGALVATTFAPVGYPTLENLQVFGARPFDEMKDMVQNADIYLATTQETFGIGTLEAMAAGVPVLGFDWGGTAEIVRHQVTGYLAKPYDYEGLLAGYQWLTSRRAEISANCREAARAYDWPNVIWQYGDLYEGLFHAPRDTRIAVVITCHNYAEYVGEAIQSVFDQDTPVDDIVIVDDGSTDSSRDVITRAVEDEQKKFRYHPTLIFQNNQGVAAARNNGIRATDCPFVICLDADDRLAPSYTRVVHDALAADPSLGIAYTGLRFLHPDGTTSPSEFPPEFDWESQATPHNPPSNRIHCAAAFRRSMWERVGGFQQVWAPGEDAEFWTRGLSVGFNARKVTRELLFEYRLHEDSASRTKVYRPVDTWLPWMRDKDFPMGAPAKTPPRVRSYSRPAVSVIVPVGPGHAKYLPAALDSLLGQSFREWEAIVINDTHPDDDEIAAALKPYPFAKVIETRFDGGQGAGFARNLGIDAAKAPFILFLDADDYLMPAAIEKMVKAAASGRYVYTDWVALKADGTVEQLPSPDYDRDEILGRLEAHAVTALVPTAWAREIGGFDADLPGWEEFDFYMRLAIAGFCGVRLAEPLLGYRVYSGTRRKISQARQKELYAEFRKRYPLEVKMAGCCGGNAEALLQAKRIVNGEMAVMESAMNSPLQGEMVRVEFVGPWDGPVPFRANGRTYYGANSPLYKYQDMPREDAEVLAKTDKFRIVVFPPAAVTVDAPAVEGVRPTVENLEPAAPIADVRARKSETKGKKGN